MSRYSIADFIESSRQQDRGEGFYELESERMLEVNLHSGSTWMKHGAMIAYRGSVNFERERILEKGLGKMLKKAVTGEGARLTRASGTGHLYLADEGKKISIVSLVGESLVVNGPDILAFEETLDWDVTMMKRVTAIAAGGLFNVKLSGSGMLAISTHYDPMTLMVEPGQPVFTDPNATVAWSAGLQPELKTDIQLKSLLGRGSGESFQMKFDGSGFVVVQPYEERPLQATHTG